MLEDHPKSFTTRDGDGDMAVDTTEDTEDGEAGNSRFPDQKPYSKNHTIRPKSTHFNRLKI